MNNKTKLLEHCVNFVDITKKQTKNLKKNYVFISGYCTFVFDFSFI